MEKTYMLSEPTTFYGNTVGFVSEFYGQRVVVYRRSLYEWVVYYHDPKMPFHKLIILPDDDGGAGARYVYAPQATVAPVGGWGIWEKDQFTDVYVPYNGEPLPNTVWVRLLPDDEDGNF